MKTSILRTVGLAVIVFLMSNFAVSAQKPFYDTKREAGRVVSITKYVMGDFGLYEQESVSKYTYDENGDFLKKEVYVWNPKHVWQDKTGRYCPDYSKSNWTPKYCIEQKRDLENNLVSLELLLWNEETKKYDKSIGKTIYQVNDLDNTLNYLAQQKGNQIVEKINKINLNKDLLAEFAE